MNQSIEARENAVLCQLHAQRLENAVVHRRGATREFSQRGAGAKLPALRKRVLCLILKSSWSHKTCIYNTLVLSFRQEAYPERWEFVKAARSRQYTSPRGSEIAARWVAAKI